MSLSPNAGLPNAASSAYNVSAPQPLAAALPVANSIAPIAAPAGTVANGLDDIKLKAFAASTAGAVAAAAHLQSISAPDGLSSVWPYNVSPSFLNNYYTAM